MSAPQIRKNNVKSFWVFVHRCRFWVSCWASWVPCWCAREAPRHPRSSFHELFWVSGWDFPAPSSSLALANRPVRLPLAVRARTLPKPWYGNGGVSSYYVIWSYKVGPLSLLAYCSLAVCGEENQPNPNFMLIPHIWSPVRCWYSYSDDFEHFWCEFQLIQCVFPPRRLPAMSFWTVTEMPWQKIWTIPYPNQILKHKVWTLVWVKINQL